MKGIRRAGCRLIAVAFAFTGVAAAAGPDLRLVEAAKNADTSAVRALLRQGLDATVAYGDGTTALHWAAYRDDGESADLLIQAGAKVNVANALGATPLWAASENGSPAMVRRLLQAGAEPNTPLPSGETPLMTAARAGNADVVRQLLLKGADPNARERTRGQTALMWATAQKHPSVVEVLLEHRADVRARTETWIEVMKTSPDTANAGLLCQPRAECYITDVTQGGYTPLLFAARVGDLASAKLLVAGGADVNDVAPYGTSATVVAAHSGNGQVATFLLEQGADPNADGAGYSALHAAILQKDEPLAGALLAHGANPNARIRVSTPIRRDSVDFHINPAFIGATPFWLAARYNVPGIMRLLAQHGADPLFVHHPEYWLDGFGATAGDPAKASQHRSWIAEGDTTAVMAAAGMGGRRQPLFAVDHPRRIAEAARVARQAPDPAELEIAALAALKVAADLGVDVNVANAAGNTALHIAASRGHTTVVAFLIEHGAKLDVRNSRGQTPLALAMASSASKANAELLQKLGAKP